MAENTVEAFRHCGESQTLVETVFGSFFFAQTPQTSKCNAQIHVLLADAAFDKLDPNANITIKWDVVEWTGDGYRVSFCWQKMIVL